MKRLLAGALAFVLLVGCTKALPDEYEPELPVVTILVMGGSSPIAVQRISLAASEITAQRLGCRVSFQMADRVDYSAELNRLRLNEALPDLFVVEGKAELSRMATAGEIMPLDSLLDEGDPLYQEIQSPTEWRNVTLNGRIFAVPYNNNQPFSLAFGMRQDICAELGIDAGQIASLEQLHAALLQVKAAYPDIQVVAPNYNELAPSVWWDTLSYQGKISNAGVLPYSQPQTTQLALITQVPEFKAWCETMYQWSQDGLIMPDVSFNQEARVALINTGDAFGGFSRYNISTEFNQQINISDTLTYAILSELRMDYTDNSSAFCINQGAENPVLCKQVLELLYTDTDFLRLCTMGQEGVDYTLENGSPQSGMYGENQYIITLWCWPNNQRLFDAEQQALQQARIQQVITSPAAGFWFNSSGFAAEMAACENLMNQYYRALMNGEVNPALAIPALEDALLAAGVQVLLAEQQRQLDEWIV